MRTVAVILGIVAALQQGAVMPKLQKISVTVTDKDGRFVPNLGPQDFVFEEDGVRRGIAAFSQVSDVPVSLGLLIDKSTSMRLPITPQGQTPVSAALFAATGAARVLVRLMKPQDEFLLMTFDEDLQVVQNFTEDSSRITSQLNKMYQVGGSTHLYKAMVAALKRMEKAKYRRRALVVITDVHDTSGKSYSELVGEIQEHEIGIYTFGMRAVPDEMQGLNPADSLVETILRRLATDTGGLSMVVDVPELRTDDTIRSMIGFVDSIALALRGQYSLSYYTEKTNPLANRVLRVRTIDPNLRARIDRSASDKN